MNVVNNLIFELIKCCVYLKKSTSSIPEHHSADGALVEYTSLSVNTDRIVGLPQLGGEKINETF